MKDNKLDFSNMSLEEILNLDFDIEVPKKSIQYLTNIEEIENEITKTDRTKVLNSKVPYTEYFDTEEELIETLKLVIPENVGQHINGFGFIKGFAKTVRDGKELSKKQVTQCKRIASQIKLAYLEECKRQLGYIL
jgi:hypothetical protein|nr:MAG TPA: hypothetical protein [Caudoviricetes sp.]